MNTYLDQKKKKLGSQNSSEELSELYKDGYWEIDSAELESFNRRPAHVLWKFDYRPSKLVIDSLSIKLQFATFDEKASVKWMIQLLPTRSNPDPDWLALVSDTNAFLAQEHYKILTNNNHKDFTVKIDLLDCVRGQHGFKLKALLSSSGKNVHCWQQTQIFRQNKDSPYKNNKNSICGLVDDDECFGLDVRVELKPQFVCELPLNNITYSSPASTINQYILDDVSTSDFTIVIDNDYDVTISTSASNESSKNKSFHVHSKVLTDNSEYFKALINSSMIESQSRTLLLKDTSYQTMKPILEFLYTGELSSINNNGDDINEENNGKDGDSGKYEEEQWIDLLYAATRFLIKPLIQRCEKELGNFVTMENVDEFELLANECGSDQLLTYCKLLFLKSPDDVYLNDKLSFETSYYFSNNHCYDSYDDDNKCDDDYYSDEHFIY
ncbi:13327_t:CDS:2 [Entrophospora sp. SA101]|nr:13327_t:CDS:2 [Entrophospora sp. SA101]